MKKNTTKTFHAFVIIAGLITGLSISSLSLAMAASIADVPVPSLPGANGSTKHVYTVLHTLNTQDTTTSFHCTSTEKTGGKNIQWGVELFGNGTLENNILLGEGVLQLTPGDSDVINIYYDELFLESETLTNSFVSRGVARILADSNKIICSAFLLDSGSPPAFVTSLPILKKTTQKGQ